MKVLPIIHVAHLAERSFLTRNSNLVIQGLSTHKNKHFELLFIKIAQQTKKQRINN